MAGLYIHIPYCRKKCIYCDFFSGGARQASWKGLADALLNELRSRINELTEPINTFYIGGGTPSMMPAEIVHHLVIGLREIVGEKWQPSESSIELNPDDVNHEYIDTLIENGFNRFSLGVQVLNDELLNILGRNHDTQCALNAMRIIKSKKINMSVDVIFGIPGMTINTWNDTLSKIVDLRPHHISAYALMYESGTALTVLRDNNRLTPADDAQYIQQYELLTTIIKKAGYQHYETSNYCLPGYHSRHNISYWQGIPYIGLGPSSHSYDGSRLRRANLADIKGYLEGRLEYTEEYLTDEMLRDEFLLTRLRMADGFQFSDFKHRFGTRNAQILLKNIPRIEGLQLKDGKISIDPNHILVADDIISSTAAMF